MDVSSLTKTHTAIALIETSENGWESIKTAVEGAHILHSSESHSPNTTPANTKEGATEVVKNIVQSGTPAKPVAKSNVPVSKHGYSIQTGVFKDTVITKVNKPGDTIRTYKQVIVPIKPRKVKF